MGRETEYELFGANMTVDTREGLAYSSSGFAACKSCQCACHLCRGHKFPQELETLAQEKSEEVFRQLLAA